jgi:hypothetical protein
MAFLTGMPLDERTLIKSGRGILVVSISVKRADHGLVTDSMFDSFTTPTSVFAMDVEPPPIQTIQSTLKEEDIDQLLADDADDSSDFEEELDPNVFRIHDPLPDYREYKRNLLEVHRRHLSVLCVRRF